ncbi:hypothetical protein EZS27_022159 [termite gut metagenome]|uniref:Uncharacterized protein n=1 Tax=termite gut metagenome TaxID=433724 RepID=A0A5J4R4A8_9ZZZZ
MKHKILSSIYNMSLGFLPVVVCCLSSLFVSLGTAVCVGIGFGFLYLFYWRKWKRVRFPNIILHISIGVLIIYFLIMLFSDFTFGNTFPLVLEISIIIPVFVFYLVGSELVRFFCRKKAFSDERNIRHSIEASFVAARILLIFGLIHLFVILIIRSPGSDTTVYCLYKISPLLVFIFGMLFNQIGINCFNKMMMSQEEFLPVMNEKGEVFGKILKTEIAENKTFIYPIVRIIISVKGMLFLQSSDCEQIDTPLQSHLLFNETLEESTGRIIKRMFSNGQRLTPIFSIVYRFRDVFPERLIYLYILDMENESLLHDKQHTGGKLWSLQQIKDNLRKGIFGECLEHEYEHLSDVIYTREKYKGL